MRDIKIIFLCLLFLSSAIMPLCFAVDDLTGKAGAKINSGSTDPALPILAGQEVQVFTSGCITLNSGKAIFIPTKTSPEWNSFYTWAVSHPDQVTFGPCAAVPACPNGTCDAGENCSTCPADCGACPASCPNGACDAGENCSTCPADCGACPASCPNGACDAGENCTTCPADCGACPTCSSADLVPVSVTIVDTFCAPVCDGVQAIKVCYSFDLTNCSPPVTVYGTNACVGCPTPPGGGGGGSTTPYLFTMSGGKYYVEVDVMETYRDQYYEVAKDHYEHNTGDPLKSRQEDYYKLKLKPDVGPDGLKFLIKEIEPEESHIDQVRMIRVIHSKDAYVFADEQSNTIKVVKDKQPQTAVKCTFNNTDCLGTISKVDDQHIEAGEGSEMTVQFDLTGLDRGNLYLVLHAWENQLMELQSAPFKAKATSLVPWVIIDPDHPDKAIQLKHLHPRQIESGMEVGLGDALKDFKGNTLTMKIGWTAHHFIDFIGLLESKAEPFHQEELALTKAVDSHGADVTNSLLRKDNVYADTVRGDQIELTFAKPVTELKSDEAETYFFEASGFYHGLRTYLHPKADTSVDSFRRELKTYVDQLDEYLKSTGNNHEQK